MTMCSNVVVFLCAFVVLGNNKMMLNLVTFFSFYLM